jgi:hypothetical protein
MNLLINLIPSSASAVEIAAKIMRNTKKGTVKGIES